MKIVRTGILLFFMIAVFFSVPAFAQCVPGSPCIGGGVDYTPGGTDNDPKTDEPACDGDFMNQIYARAFIEAERENVLAQTYIVKPDSVMEYSCVDRILGQGNPNAINLFSSSTVWQNRTIPLNIAYTAAGNPTSIQMTTFIDPSHFTTAVNEVVGVALGEWIGTGGSTPPDNFGHDFLGGTAGIGSSIGSTLPGGAYSCDAMRAVWELAKCQNFDTATNTFWTFDELAAGDPRQFPDPGACVTDVTTDLITTAENLPTGTTYPAATFDALNPHLDLLLPATSDADCQDPVLTGLNVTLYNYTFGASTSPNPSGIDFATITVPEGVCINPGCYYHTDVNWSPPPTPTPGPGIPPVVIQLCPDGSTATGAPPICPAFAPPGECRDG